MTVGKNSKAVTIVLGVIGADCHSVGNRVLADFFVEKGFDVVNLGVMVSKEEFINAASESSADAILVSSLYGHGEIDCEGLRAACNDKGLKDILLYIGGNLVVGKKPFEEVARKFRDMGFDRVFPHDVELETVAENLCSDISMKHQRKDTGINLKQCS